MYLFKIIKIFVAIFLSWFFLGAAGVSALSVVVNVPEKYAAIKAGERIYFEVAIKYPENPRRKDLRLIYEITKDDEVVNQAKFLKAIETQASFMDYIVIPENSEEGLYSIDVKIQDYESLSEEVSTGFIVLAKLNQMRIYFYILLGVTILMSGAVILTVVLRSRKS